MGHLPAVHHHAQPGLVLVPVPLAGASVGQEAVHAVHGRREDPVARVVGAADVADDVVADDGVRGAVGGEGGAERGVEGHQDVGPGCRKVSRRSLSVGFGHSASCQSYVLVLGGFYSTHTSRIQICKNYSTIFAIKVFIDMFSDSAVNITWFKTQQTCTFSEQSYDLYI